MSKEIKLANLSQAEDYLIAQRREIANLRNQQTTIAQEARQSAIAEAGKRINEIRKEQEKREAKYNSALDGMSSSMQRMETDHQESLINLKKESIKLVADQSKSFNQKLGNLQEWTKESIESISSELNNSLKDLSNSVNVRFKEQQSQLQSIKKDISNIYNKEKNEEVKAKQMAHDLGKKIYAIANGTLHSKFFPDRLSQINRSLRNALEGGFPASSLIAAFHIIFNDLYDLEENIVKEEIKFNAFYEIVLNATNELLEIMYNNRTTGQETPQGVDKKLAEVDWWNEGQMSVLISELSELRSELEGNKSDESLNEQRLNEILKKVGEINIQQSETLELALRKGYASSERVRIGEEIIFALEGAGYRLKYLANGEPAFNYLGGKEEADQREGVFLVVENGVGSEMTILVNTKETLEENQIIFNRNDNSEITEDEYIRRLRDLGEVLKKAGYDVGSLEAPKGTGDQRQIELAEPEALKVKGIRKELKKSMGLS